MRILAAAAMVVMLGVPVPASAQTVCPESAPELFPLDGSESVPRNGIVRVLYREPFSLPEHAARDVIEVFDDEGLRLAGAATLGNDPTGEGAEAVWRSELLLPADSTLTVEVQDPVAADPNTFSFTTGSLARDESQPEFEGASKVEIVDAVGDLSEPGTYEVRVTFPLAEDEVGPGNVEYVTYQTDGPDWTRPLERRRVR